MLLRYTADVVGRRRFKLRETHVRDRYVPLIRKGAVGAVKLDMLLRGVASGSYLQTPGLGRGNSPNIPADISWEALHDLVRPGETYSGEVDLKRKWVGEQLLRLERMRLISRQHVPGGRPRLTVLADDASGRQIDNPTGATPADFYVTILGRTIRDGWLCRWGAPEVSAYIAAMIAERYARADPDLAEVWNLQGSPLGGGRWFRPLHWFGDAKGLRPATHIRTPFSVRTLRRGFKTLDEQGLIARWLLGHDPRDPNFEFEQGPRMIYQNRFAFAPSLLTS